MSIMVLLVDSSWNSLRLNLVTVTQKIMHGCIIIPNYYTGKKEAMEELEEKFLAGEYTPVKATTAPPPKKLRTTGECYCTL